MGKMKIYSKPTAQYVEIITNDLCAASICTTIDLNTIKLNEMKRRDKTYAIKDGGSKNMWDSKF